MPPLRLKISNIDRVGLVFDISRVLTARQANITSMEVELNTVFIQTEQLADCGKHDIMVSLAQIPQVTGVTEISLMPHQERAESINAVLASVSDGIVAIDRQAVVTQYNPAAERIISIPRDDVLGKPITSILPANLPLLDALKHGAVYNNREILLERTNSHYLASGRPIIGEDGEIIGAVAIIKDISDVREMVYTVTGQLTLSFYDILYTSKVMQKAAAAAKAVALGHSTILIRGETGTGKELFARAIHRESPRSGAVFVPLNCAAIPDTLLESELFGYEEGSFTGALKGGKKGLFELADGGTLFLDEIGELSASLQAKLLRVLQENTIRRVGGTREIPINVRIIAATNRNLEEMLFNKAYREDLYYRLNVIPLFTPPLRERREDIEPLARFFLQRLATRLRGQVKTLSDTALQKLREYHWPGNVRELENVMERCVNLTQGPLILVENLQLDHDYTPSIATVSTPNRPLAAVVAEVEKEALASAISQYGSSRQIGAALGLSHTAVLKKLRKYGLHL